MTSFTNIQQALQFKNQCPFCDQLLTKDVISGYSAEMIEFAQTSWLDNKICFKIKAEISSEDMILNVCLDTISNKFDYELIGDETKVDIGGLLNLSHITVSNECIPCKYIISFSSLKFDMPSRKLHKIQFNCEQWFTQNYKVYSDGDNSFIYSLTDEGYHLVTMAPLYHLTKESAPKAADWAKTIIIFS